MSIATVLACCAGLTEEACRASDAASGEIGLLGQCSEALPSAPADCTAARCTQVTAIAESIDRWAGEQSRPRPSPEDEALLDAVDRLARARDAVDRMTDRMLALRERFSAMKEDEARREALRQYIRITAQLMDLSGRLRYASHDAIDTAGVHLSAEEARLERLVDLLRKRNSSIGAAALVPYLYDPPENNPAGLVPASDSVKSKILELIGQTGQHDLIAELADLAKSPRVSESLLIQTAETIERVGLPQVAPKDVDPNLPRPEITADALLRRIEAIDATKLVAEERARREALLVRLRQRKRRGVAGSSYRLGTGEVRPGDWLLMRNPSPFNLFTDLSPGLFTHVGVVTALTDQDGVRRIVVVDLPEKGTRMPATNAEIYVRRTLHYFFLRPKDPEVAKTMAAVAAEVVGNPIQFDTNFRTQRVAELRGKPLRGRRIHAYCAGILLLCAQETGRPREAFFPIPEYQARGKTPENLGVLGLSIGEDFVSPTGALFSGQFEIAARREPMYSPRREIEQSIYNHFGRQFREEQLVLSLSEKQSLRLRMAEAAKTNPLLAKAIAQAAGVSDRMDLVAGAKTAAVVESLDEAAYGASERFEQAREAFSIGPLDDIDPRDFPPEAIERIKKLRTQHAKLFERWISRTITPRELRVALVRYYVRQGCRQIDERFFLRHDERPVDEGKK